MPPALTSLRPLGDIQVKVLGGAERESENDLLHEQRVVSVEGRPERRVERHLAPDSALLRGGGRAHVEQRAGHERHDEREDGVGHAVDRADRQVVVVSHVVAVGLGAEVERVDETLAEDRREELFVGDVLYLGADRAPRLLKWSAGFDGNVNTCTALLKCFRSSV